VVGKPEGDRVSTVSGMLASRLMVAHGEEISNPGNEEMRFFANPPGPP